MALLETLCQLAVRNRWTLHVAHINHLLRGTASDADEALVCRWARKHSLRMHCERRDIAATARKHKQSIEDAARRVRYAHFEKVAKKTGATKIVLAHTADDQAETLLWRLLRGSVQGLAGMPTQRALSSDEKIMVVRPFLSVRKRDLISFLKEEKIPFRLDASNRNAQFTRNKIRNKLIPDLERGFNPQLVATLNATARALAHQNDLLAKLTQKSLSKGILRVGKSAATLNVKQLAKQHPALQAEILKKAYEASGADREKLKNDHIQQMIGMVGRLPGSKELHLGNTRIRREQDSIVFSSRTHSHRGTPPLWRNYVILSEGKDLARQSGSFASLRMTASRSASQKNTYEEFFDKDTLALPLRLRPRKPGDRYQPIGLKGTKKIKDILMDQKIPLSERNNVPVLVDARNRICWLAGYRIAEFCKVRPRTRNVLRLKLKPALN